MANDKAEVTLDFSQWEKKLDFIAKNKMWTASVARDSLADVMAIAIYPDVMDHFAKQTGPTGPWKAWSMAYAKHMKDIGKGGNLLLQDNGNLRQRFTPQSRRSDAFGITFYNNAKTKGGFPYAKAHDDGGKTLPKRNFMWLSKPAMKKMITLVEAWMNDDK